MYHLFQRAVNISYRSYFLNLANCSPVPLFQTCSQMLFQNWRRFHCFLVVKVLLVGAGYHEDG